MNDTPPDVDALYRRRLMALTPGERIRMASGMFDTARALIRGRLLAEQPDLDEVELRVRLFEQVYGRDYLPDDRERIVEALRRRSP